MVTTYGVKFADAWRGCDMEAVKADWAEALGGYSVAELRTGIEALLAVYAATGEEELQRPGQWVAWQLDGVRRRWLTLLVDVLGYELTEWEAEKVAAAEEAAGDVEDVVEDL